MQNFILNREIAQLAVLQRIELCGPILKKNYNYLMVGRVGYAPTTPAMSMQYSTIELTAQ